MPTKGFCLFLFPSPLLCTYICWQDPRTGVCLCVCVCTFFFLLILKCVQYTRLTGRINLLVEGNMPRFIRRNEINYLMDLEKCVHPWDKSLLHKNWGKVSEGPATAWPDGEMIPLMTASHHSSLPWLQKTQNTYKWGGWQLAVQQQVTWLTLPWWEVWVARKLYAPKTRNSLWITRAMWGLLVEELFAMFHWL